MKLGAKQTAPLSKSITRLKTSVGNHHGPYSPLSISIIAFRFHHCRLHYPIGRGTVALEDAGNCNFPLGAPPQECVRFSSPTNGIHFPHVDSIFPIWIPFSTSGIHFPHVDSISRRILHNFVLVPFSPEFPHIWIPYSPSGFHFPHLENTFHDWTSHLTNSNHTLEMWWLWK